MTPEAYLYQVLAPAVMAVVETMVRAMTAASLVALLGGVLATAWKFRGSIAIAKPAFDTGEHDHLSDAAPGHA